MWLLMLIPFGIVLSTGVFFAYYAVRRAREKRAAESPDFSHPGAAASFRLSLLEQPCRWLAIKTRNPAMVQAALKLHRATPCSWEEGLVEARENKLFISPPVSGWVFVVGVGLPEPSEDVDVCYRFLTHLSRKLGHVQFFSVNRVLNHHSWALLENGRVFRGYAWAGSALWNQGPQTSAEKELDIVCFPYASDSNAFTSRESLSNNCDKVGQLAGRWSLDPNTLTPSSWKAGGIVGQLSS